MKASSVQSKIADSLFLGKVSDIILDFAAKREHYQLTGLYSLPVYMAVPPANSAASTRQINLIFDP